MSKEANVYVAESVHGKFPFGTVLITATSSTQARSYLAKQMVKVRLAKPSELLAAKAEDVLDATAEIDTDPVVPETTPVVVPPIAMAHHNLGTGHPEGNGN